MDFVVNTSSAGLATLLLVGLFKLARPAASALSVVAAAVLSGLLCSLLVAVAQATPLTAQNLAVMALGGIFAAAAAAGVRSVDNRADEGRRP